MKTETGKIPPLEELSTADIINLETGTLLDALISKNVFHRVMDTDEAGEFRERFCGGQSKPSPYSTVDIWADTVAQSLSGADFQVRVVKGRYRFLASISGENGTIDIIDTGFQETYPAAICKGSLLVVKSMLHSP